MSSDKFLKDSSRIGFVKFWVDYIKRTPNKVWSKQQADFINSVLKNANQDRDLYLKVKEIVSRNR